MYARILSYTSSAARLSALLTLLCLGSVQEGYGQRVYADTQESSPTQRLPILGTILSQVESEGNATTSSDLTYSTLRVALGALNLYSATQNLQFTGANAEKLRPTSPIMVKTMVNGSVLGLLDAVSLQRTNGGIDEPVGDPYTVTQLLDLLGIIGGTDEELLVVLPVPGATQLNDGVQLKVSSVLSLGLSARLYYAFYITPPEVSPSPLVLCGNSEGSITITNFQPGYNYHLYSEQIGGTVVDSTISNTLEIPSSSLPVDTLWLEARENNLYPSARTPIIIKRNFITGGTIAGDQSICVGSLPSTITETDVATGTGTLMYQWQQKTTGAYEDIVGATAATYTPPALLETTVFRRITTSELDSVECMAYSNEITITVNPLPTITLASIPPICEGEITAILPYANTTGDPDQYSIIWDSGAVGFTNVTDETLTADAIAIAIPTAAEMGTYTGTLTVRNSETGCESEAVPFTIEVLPQPGRPHLTITDVQN